ncbi:MAG TPA: hypothetical protein VJT71_20450 [Pyrinomonadaceae bacterium]|nr:hypothetical protein [Pyrinomonadaceae bacterium]
MSEQLIPLSEEDRQVLIRKRKRALILALGLLGVSLLFLSPLVVVHTFVWVVLLGSLGIGLALMSPLPFYSLYLLVNDLRGNQKQMISGPVEAQNVDVTRTKDEDGVEGAASYRFWIQIRSKKVTVSEEQYYQFKKGDIATAFIAPHSGNVLGLDKENVRRPFS